MEVNGEYSTNIDVDIEDFIEDNEGMNEGPNPLQRSKVAKKKERTQKQIESLKKAQATRKRNIQLRKEGKVPPKINKKALAGASSIVMEDLPPDVQDALLEEEEAQDYIYHTKGKHMPKKTKKKAIKRRIVIQHDSSESEEEEEVIVIQNRKKKRKKRAPLVEESSDDDSEGEYSMYTQHSTMYQNSCEPTFRFV